MTQMHSRSLIFLLACFAPIAIFSEEVEPSSEEACAWGKRHCRVSVRHIEAGGIGYSEGYTTLEGFFAPDPQQLSVMPFLDLRGHVFNNGKMAANAGLGCRGIWGCRTYGLNAYYDYRNTKKLHYNQVGVGLETLGTLWDFRINGYLPVGRKITAPYNAEFDAFSGHYLLLHQKRQFAMKGADAEFGFHFGKTKNFDFYAAAGPYYFIGEIGSNTWGGKARLSGMYKEYITVEVSDSYDRMFHNNFQGQLTFTWPFGGKSRVKTTDACHSCQMADAIVSRMVQPVGREEIVVVGKETQTAPAIDPATGLPYFFVFVDNTSHSEGTFESPYPTFALAQTNSGPNNIIYVFPGDGTSTGMNAGIALQDFQKLWGSGISHSLQTTVGTVSIPAQSSSFPTITNTDLDTEGNAVTLAAHNEISGFTIASATIDAIYGTAVQSLDVSFCIFQNTNTYPIEATFPGNASISITNNQLTNNVNGFFFTLNGTSNLVCSNNTFTGQTSVSNVPLEIAANSNVFSAQIENNIMDANTTGGVRIALNNVLAADIHLLNNTIANSGTGFQSSLGSSLVLIQTGVVDNCSIVLNGNTFSGNTSNALYMHTSGAFTNLTVAASRNTMSNNGGSGLVLATPTDTLTLTALNNTITGCNDNGIAVISSGTTSNGTITINNNVIANIGNSSNGIAVNQDFTNLDLTLLSNAINGCEGTGILSYAPTGIGSLTLNASNNTISNCQNLSSNAASGLDIEQFTAMAGSVTNNTFTSNTGTAVVIGSTLTSPTACLTLSGNTSTDYLLTNPVDGVFNLSPCNVDSVNVGTINTSGTINTVQSCSDPTLCPP